MHLSLYLTKNFDSLIGGNKWYGTALVATVTIAYQGQGSNKSMGVAGGGGGCYQTQREANRWEWECGAERGKKLKGGEEKDVTGARVNWAHAPFLHLHPQLPVPSLSLSTTFVSAGAYIIKITSSLFITTCGRAAQSCLITHGGWRFSPGVSDVPYPEGRIEMKEFLHPVIYCSPPTELCPVQTGIPDNSLQCFI